MSDTIKFIVEIEDMPYADENLLALTIERAIREDVLADVPFVTVSVEPVQP
jgi:hypothetical protein